MVENQFSGGGGEENKKERKRKEKEEKPKWKKNQAMRERKSYRRGEEKGKGREGKRRFSHCSDGRSSIVRELKLVHATRATHGYRNQNFSSKLQEVGVFSYIGSSLFKSRKWPCSSAQTRD